MNRSYFNSMNDPLLKTAVTFFGWRLAACLLWFAAMGGALQPTAFGQSDVYLKLSTSERRQVALAVAPLQAAGRAIARESEAAQRLIDVLAGDLRFSLYYRMVSAPATPRFGFRKGVIDYEAWRTIGAELVLVPLLSLAKGSAACTVAVHDIGQRREVYRQALPLAQGRSAAHAVCDEIILRTVGERGIARTRIAFCLKVGKHKELAVMDYDGQGAGRLTAFGSTVLSPDWSPDGGRLALMSFAGPQTVVYTLDLSARTSQELLRQPGVNVSPAWAPDGSALALTMSRDGNAEIFTYDLRTKAQRRLTNSWAIDCSPAWSPSGREIAFVSDRAGSPQIYLMDADGGNIRRLIYEGSYNTSPAWSPKGDLIAFVSRVKGEFQICTISPTGDGHTQLTYEGDNEDPSWSPDGLHLAFSSDRTGRDEIWLMHWDGSEQRAVTSTGGATMPAWSPFPAERK
ncbi:MAG: Tol-Pal system beta propeller repeat protein TolB [Candidatus Edwardsbacteria bacterium]|nr:Tol-Pal system beta propeller repeat protein TolB [Candidatus Edwardsbacteria bacterium]